MKQTQALVEKVLKELHTMANSKHNVAQFGLSSGLYDFFMKIVYGSSFMEKFL